MANKVRQRRHRAAWLADKRWRALFILCLIAAMLASPIILAQQHKMQPASKSTGYPSPQVSNSPASLAPNSPSKEYFHLNGKLVATEEPAP